jgi:hypothetical protein
MTNISNCIFFWSQKKLIIHGILEFRVINYLYNTKKHLHLHAIVFGLEILNFYTATATSGIFTSIN